MNKMLFPFQIGDLNKPHKFSLFSWNWNVSILNPQYLSIFLSGCSATRTYKICFDPKCFVSVWYSECWFSWGGQNLIHMWFKWNGKKKYIYKTNPWGQTELSSSQRNGNISQNQTVLGLHSAFECQKPQTDVLISRKQPNIYGIHHRRTHWQIMIG